MICGEIGAEERLFWVRQLDRQTHLFVFGEGSCDCNVPFVDAQDTGAYDVGIDTWWYPANSAFNEWTPISPHLFRAEFRITEL